MRREFEPFQVGDRVRPVGWKDFGGGEIISIENAMALVRFDVLLVFKNELRDMHWRIDRLGFENPADLDEDYFF